jgi:hypothetical protein
VRPIAEAVLGHALTLLDQDVPHAFVGDWLLERGVKFKHFLLQSECVRRELVLRHQDVVKTWNTLTERTHFTVAKFHWTATCSKYGLDIPIAGATTSERFAGWIDTPIERPMHRGDVWSWIGFWIRHGHHSAKNTLTAPTTSRLARDRLAKIGFSYPVAWQLGTDWKWFRYYDYL